MKILILHRVPYGKIDYHRGIDHDAHDVVYMGEAEALKDIPSTLRHRCLVRGNHPGGDVRQACLEALRNESAFDRIISVSEFELLLAAELREALNVPGATLDTVRLVRDKILMKDAVARAGLRVPRHAAASAILADKPVMALQGLWLGRTIVKPVDGAASEGVTLHATRAEASAALLQSKRTDLEMEEFVEGPILHFDGLMCAGRLEVALPSRYVGTCLDFARGQPLGSVQVPWDEIDEPLGVRTWVERCLQATGINDGAFHLEAIQAKEGLVFLEVGARVGGADVAACFEMATGVHLPSEELKRHVSPGQGPSLRDPGEAQVFYGWFVFPAHHHKGSTYSIWGARAFSRHPSVKRWHQRAARADAGMRISYQAVEAPLAGIVAGVSASALEGFLGEMFRRVRIYSDITTERRQLP